MVESAMKARRHQPQFMVDIAVPRDIEAEVSELDDVYLYTVDDLQSVIEEGQRAREEAAIDALDIIDANVTQFQDRLKASSASGLIKQYRQKMEDLRVQELEKSIRQLENGDDPERVVRNLARSLTNKIIHSPTSALIAAAKNDDQTTLDAADNILGLSLSSDESETP
jgi:glutamyl-tRNA reductase